MRKLLCILISCIVLLVLVTGCSSIGAVIRSNMSGYPSWYYNPQANQNKNQIGFAGVGRSSTQRQATLLAYEDILSQLGEYLGDEPDNEAYRELSMLGTIGLYGLSVKDTQMLVEGNETVVFVRVSANKKLMEEASSEETKRRAKVLNEIQDFVQQGIDYLKAGKETRGLTCFLDAMCDAWNQDYLPSRYSFDNLLDETLDILSSMTISLESQSPEIASCKVVMTRKEGIVPSKVKDGEVLATYKALDIGENEYNDSFVYSTDQNGSFVFTPLNYSLQRTGSIVFSLNFGSQLEKLELCGVGPEVMQKLRSEIDSKTVEFLFERDYSLGSISVCGIEYDEKGYAVDFVRMTNYLKKRYTDDGAPVLEFLASNEDVDGILAEYTQKGNVQDCFLLLRIGLVEDAQSMTGLSMATVTGNAVLYKTSDMSVLYDSGIVAATGFAEDIEAAKAKASENLADVIYTLLKAVYV